MFELNNYKFFIGFGILAMMGVVLVSGCLEEKESKYLGMPVEEIKSNALTVTYLDLMEHEKDYIGKIVYIKGKIYKQETNRIYVNTLDKNENEIQIVHTENLSFQEGDIIDIWGEFYEVRTYKTFSSENTYPAIYQLHIEKSK